MNILTFDIGVTNIRYALCDEQFRLSDVHTVPTRAQQGGQQIMERLLEIIGTYQHIDRVAVYRRAVWKVELICSKQHRWC